MVAARVVTNKFGLVADDLTGANDAGVQFSKHGLKTVVLLNPTSGWEEFGKVGSIPKESASRAFEARTPVNIQEVLKAADVIAIDTDSRALDPQSAYNRVRNAVRILKDAGITGVYKKIDSTMRGNIGAELDAAMDELEAKLAFISPTFPATQRTTLGGRLLVRNVPVEATEIAQDPLSPVKDSYIPAILGRQTRRRIGCVSLEAVEGGLDTLLREFSRLEEQGYEILVLDATSQEHLRTIA